MRTRNKGFILLMTMTLLASLVALANVMLVRALVESRASTRYLEKTKSFHAAEAGLDVLLAENRNAGWTFLTRNADNTPASSMPIPTFSGATIDGTGAYVLPLGGDSAAAYAQPDPMNPSMVRIQSVGISNGVQTTVTEVIEPVGLLQYAWLVDGNVELRNGQKLTFEGGTGRIHVEGNLTLEGGNHGTTPALKAIEVQAGSINIYGALRRTAGTPATEAPIYISKYNSVTGVWEKKEVPAPTSSATPWQSTDNPADYSAWLTSAPADFTDFLKEINTGATPRGGVLDDIDTFVHKFSPGGAQPADIAISDTTGLSSLPCSSAFSAHTFANPSTVKMVTVVEIDANLLTNCLGSANPPVVYSEVPVRLTGDTLNSGLTVVSPEAIYVKGDFNKINPKGAAIITGNHTYHVSGSFKDYQGFVAPAPGKTVPQTIAAWNDQTAGYNNFVSTYGDPAAQNTTIPPYAAWLQEYAPPTEQHVAIIAPLQKSNEHSLTGHDHTMQDWGKSSPEPHPGKVLPPDDGVNVVKGKILLRQVGAFINLRDNDPTRLADGTTPHDIRHPDLDDYNITNVPRREFIYDGNLPLDSPPGFSAQEEIIRYWGTAD